MAAYNKAIAAFLTQLAALGAVFGLDPEWVTPELISSVSVVVTTALVYLLPNKTGGL